MTDKASKQENSKETKPATRPEEKKPQEEVKGKKETTGHQQSVILPAYPSQ